MAVVVVVMVVMIVVVIAKEIRLEALYFVTVHVAALR